MQALCSHQHKYPALPLGTNSHFHAVLACKLNWWSSMQVSGSSCDVLAHARSLIVNRMSHLNYLLPHSCHVHVWYQLQLMHSGCPLLVTGLFLLCFLDAKACVVAKLVACFALVFFGLHWNPSRWAESPHLLHLSLFLWANLGWKLFLYWFGGLCSPFFWCACFCLVVVFSFCTCHW